MKLDFSLSFSLAFALVAAPLVTSTFAAEAQSPPPRRVPPNVLLLVDSSGSTYWGSSWTYCPYWNAQHGLPAGAMLNINQTIRAALTECWNDNDGIIYRYAPHAQMAVYGFGFAYDPMTRLLAPFFSPASALEAAVDSIEPEGLSPINAGIRDSGQYMASALNGINVPANSKNFILLITDANPNGYDTYFNYACNGATQLVPPEQPQLGAEYLSINPDIFCGWAGDQTISTYVIVVGEAWNFDPVPMQEIASRSGGEYYNVLTHQQLRDTLKLAFNSMFAR